jgi:hypothetical protein
MSVAVSDGSYSVAKQYLVTTSYAATSNTWELLAPVADTGAWAGTANFAVDINVNIGICYLRLRNILGTTQATASIVIEDVSYLCGDGISVFQTAANLDVFTPTTGTGSASAPGSTYTGGVTFATSGSSGSSGVSGSSGTSGAAGAAGTSGTSGSSGVSGASTSYERLNADFSTTSGTAVSSNLTFTPGNLTSWIVDCQLTSSSGSSGGLYYQVTAPVSSTVEGWVYATDTSGNFTVTRLTTANTNTLVGPFHGAGVLGADRICFAIHTSSSGGNITIAAASQTGGNTTKLLAGSSLLARKATDV